MKFHFPCSECFCSTSEDKVVHKNGKGQREERAKNFRLFSYPELKVASDGFSSKNKVGEGGFGSVYKGRLRDGTIVAIKVLSVELESMRGEREFISEIAALSDVQHGNLVTLHGCCVEGAKRCLILDYMENNSLAYRFLGSEQNRTRFSWAMRKNVSLGVAKALAYLHEEKNPHIVHRDIKASNVLLDHDFNPKVADFGLSRLFQDGTSHISTRVAGTLGYLSPEYAISGRLTRKSDVYSFGVLLLEIVSGRSVVDFDVEHGEQFLVDKAWDMYNSESLVELVDHLLLEEADDGLRSEAVRFLKVGLLCVQENTKLRPRMSEVIKMLTSENSVDGVTISQPGFVADLMDVKIDDKKKSSQSF
ncbi:putative serine/threonine-protein kinase isoform X1 [Cynara cardunculus var. scolymus]|uniref:putative serine/threonine-protein kinase isoform X1 n=1 Tax=Cynara cardunculus var. scolymus TaxID=59895 RepID=UPI000D6284E7|nr:putative serine/threonine-protein kinase isoform X1 [Cynara cardunculus var. scolymus]XP_024979615.1 putative serine/threonine-protein kinase isoform X1 [Cynara cardunculus var. scolymus]